MKLHHKLYSGRISRASYFLSLLAISIFMGFAQSLMQDSQKNITIFISTVATFVLFYLIISIWVRRLHDVGMSGWWALVIFAPVINLIFYVVLIFKAGYPKKNKYGPQPPSGIHF